MKALSIALIITLASCSKNIGLKEPTCHFYCLLSDKYLSDSTFVREDTLRGMVGDYTYACGSDIDSMKSNLVKWYINCNAYPIECERYVFDSNKSQPKIFK